MNARLAARIGVHCGEAFETGDDFVGLAIHHAARIMALANAEQIVVSADVAREVVLGPDVGFRSLGRPRLRDIDAQLELFDIVHPGLPQIDQPLRVENSAIRVPTPSSSFVERPDVRRSTIDAVRDARLVTLSGFAGTGKSRLRATVAAEIKGDFPDGVWAVQLAELADPSHLVATIVAALPVGRDVDSVDALAASLADSTLLVVLDNCEHLVDAVGDLTRRLLRRAADVRILATSRAALGLAGERVVSVSGMLPDEALALFRERAAARGASLAEDDSSIATICETVEYLPLAIELAAARTDLYTLDELAVRLTDRLAVIGDLRGGHESGHDTLAAAIEWSWNLLSERERTVFRRVTGLVGSQPLDAAIALAADDEIDADEARAAIVALQRQSLVDIRNSVVGRRVEVLELIRQFGSRRLAESGEVEVVADRHAKWFSGQVETINEEFYATRPLPWQARIAEDVENFRAALLHLATRDRSGALRMIRSFGTITWDTVGLRALLPTARQLAEERPEDDASELARAQSTVAVALFDCDEFEQGAVMAESAVACAALSDDALAGVWAQRAWAYTHRSSAAEGLESWRVVEAMAERAGPEARRLSAETTLWLARLAAQVGAPDAGALAATAVERHRQSGNLFYLAASLSERARADEPRRRLADGGRHVHRGRRLHHLDRRRPRFRSPRWDRRHDRRRKDS